MTWLRCLRLTIVGLAVLTAMVAWAPSQAAAPRVVVAHVKGVINPVQAHFVQRAIAQAEKAQAPAIILELDTPGGLDSSMRSIIQRILSSRIPVVVYVAPQGARAASAGTFITMSADVAAMAPNTAIGAAHPVGGSGQDIEGTLGEKVTNDAAAYIRSLATQRGRNADWAERAVRESISASASEALDLHVVDVLAPDVPSLLAELQGREVQLISGPVILSTQGAGIKSVRMNIPERVLFTVSDPEIAFILLSLGLLALFFEFASPGAILPGVFGGIAVLLALFALGTLPINWAGVLLIVLGVILFFAEAMAPGFGVLAAGGVVAFIFGGLLLISTSNPQFQISRWLIFSLAGIMALFFMMVVGGLVRVRRAPAVSGVEALIGREASVRTSLEPEGMVFLEGELWQAHIEEGTAQVGDRVTVTQAKGLKLTVRLKDRGQERSDLNGNSGTAVNSAEHGSG
ncbi:MAG: nodulation protein NfeD [Chloroflexi bacterium]|nr:nodulation protein NfeD [Chloroflexota bacterium]